MIFPFNVNFIKYSRNFPENRHYYENAEILCLEKISYLTKEKLTEIEIKFLDTTTYHSLQKMQTNKKVYHEQSIYSFNITAYEDLYLRYRHLLQ